jgi:hypothetical protein
MPRPPRADVAVEIDYVSNRGQWANEAETGAKCQDGSLSKVVYCPSVAIGPLTLFPPPVGFAKKTVTISDRFAVHQLPLVTASLLPTRFF